MVEHWKSLPREAQKCIFGAIQNPAGHDLGQSALAGLAFNRGLKQKISGGPCRPQLLCDSVSIVRGTLSSRTFFPVTSMPLNMLYNVYRPVVFF